MIPHSKPWITEEDQRAVIEAMASLDLANGRLVLNFEREILRVTGSSAVISTVSGTEAAVLCLASLGVGPGDEVVIPTYVCHQVRDAVQKVRAIPVYCDSSSSWNSDEESIRARITSRTKAVIVVNIFGIHNPASRCDFGVPVIEDHCQSLGALSTAANVGFTSFHATKCITTGVGGAAFFHDKSLTREVLKQRIPMSDICAALGISQLKRYQSALLRRTTIAERYFRNLPTEITETLNDKSSIYFRFPTRFQEDFEILQTRFLQNGVVVRRGVDELLHRSAGQSDRLFPKAVELFEETISLPIYPALTDSEVDEVISAAIMVWESVNE